KGSDVNLATFLLSDGYDGDYEQAVVISNDSDLALPVEMVRDKLGYPVGIVNPSANKKVPTTKELQDASTFMKRIWTKTLKSCLFPDTLVDKNGTITKPAEWNAN
ncbi:MAG: NYN domain-containing protein, partial [Chloroflexi bacterium]|nr:NYN domain-containing protein [Chloroflexota bacterium]